MILAARYLGFFAICATFAVGVVFIFILLTGEKMIKRSALSLLMTCCFAAAVIVGTSVRTANAQTCDKPDVKIVTDIYASISGDKALAGQRSHINVISLYGAVKLQGWTDTQKDYDRLTGYVSDTDCVRLVNVRMFSAVPPPPDGQTRSGGGCSSGMKACGDVCIPEGDSCSISN